MEDDLTCPVCLELFADPLMLPCSHSVCKACLMDIMKCRTKIGKQDLECPSCRDNHNVSLENLERFPKNLALENIVFRYQEILSNRLSRAVKLDSSNNDDLSKNLSLSSMKDQESFKDEVSKFLCGLCDDSNQKPAEWFCQQCEVLYCQLCLNTFHPRRGSLTNHKIKRADLKAESTLDCPDHTTEKISIFCNTCKVVACHLCVCQGRGQHGNHLIFDLETARKQLKETVTKSKDDLLKILTSFSDREGAVTANIQSLKALEESARDCVSSQYNCFLSDIEAILSVAKDKTIKSIIENTSHHLLRFNTSKQDIKTVLTQCQDLDELCENIIFQEKINKDNFTFSFSDHIPLSTTRTGLNTNISTKEDSSNSAVFFEQPNIIQSAINSKNTRSQLSTELNEKNKMKAMVQIDLFKQVDLKQRASFASGYSGYGCQLEKKLVSEGIIKDQHSSGSMETEKVEYENVLFGKDDKTNLLLVTKKCVADFKNSERKLSRETTKINNLAEAKQSLQELNATKEIQNEKNKDILLRADEITPVVEQVAALSKLIEYHHSFDVDDAKMMKEYATNIKESISDFHSTSLKLISSLAVDTSPLDSPKIIPAVRSVVSPPNMNQASSIPRVLSRILITWGFNSTTFTADPIENSAQWTVNIIKNSSHIGDIKSGYLFGVGVSTKPLVSKEQVGMNADSLAVVCVDGTIAVCQNSKLSPIIPLNDLPLSVTISVDKTQIGLFMTYKIVQSSLVIAVCGKRILILTNEYSSAGAFPDLCIKSFPVFTVSQRVKMQFPLTSDV
ncbi:uncharacterized protein LOC131950271 [Physella acuta]|uniref:uncharacterized protein LOC131950271 n=1 Tax=Physella acuta TaxID=109671 RepID=UPI0027DE86CE|nr:uncharacterized protein LOC131950271 [Physella acuta]